MPVLPDLLRPGLRLVVCGSAVGTKSKERGAYYAGPGNRFWRTLHANGVTPRLFAPNEFPLLIDLGVGLTDLAKEHWGSDAALPRDAYDRDHLRAKIEEFQPGTLIFNGKAPAQAFFGGKLVYGRQAGQAIGQTQIYVAPSTSGAANGFWDEIPWRDALGAAGFRAAGF